MVCRIIHHAYFSQNPSAYENPDFDYLAPYLQFNQCKNNRYYLIGLREKNQQKECLFIAITRKFKI